MQPEARIENLTHHTAIKSLRKNGSDHICIHCACKGSESENIKNNLKILSNRIVILKTKIRSRPQIEFMDRHLENVYFIPYNQIKTCFLLTTFPLLVAKFSLMNAARLQYEPYT